MANPEHLSILKQGVEKWNRWRKEHLEVEPDLSGAGLNEANLCRAYLRSVDFGGVYLNEANLSGADLTGAHLRGAHLNRAYLTEASLRGADLRGADLSEANVQAQLYGSNLSETNLRGANLNFAGLSKAKLSLGNLKDAELSGADLTAADLTGANLCGTGLYGTNLKGANLRETVFTEARTGATSFDDVDLSTAKDLETIMHLGPSTIGIDTIYKSHGKIPEAFLRGCGCPTSSLPTSARWSDAPSSSPPASSAIRPKTKSLPSGSMLTYKPRGCAAGSRRTTCREAAS